MTEPRHHEGFKFIGHDKTLGDCYEMEETLTHTQNVGPEVKGLVNDLSKADEEQWTKDDLKELEEWSKDGLKDTQRTYNKIKAFEVDFLSKQRPLDPTISKLVDDNFTDLI